MDLFKMTNSALVIIFFSTLFDIVTSQAPLPINKIEWPANSNLIVVKEDSLNGTRLAKLSVTGGKHPRLNSSSEYVSFIPTSENLTYATYDAVLIKALDFETMGSTVFVPCTERNDDYSKIPFTLRVYITDVNDETPVFLNRPYSINVAENAMVGHVVYDLIKANDADFSDRQLKYYFEVDPKITDTDYKSKFVINESTAQVTLNETLDYETARFYQYTVVVRDSNKHNATTDVFITIEDVQDEPPYFTGTPYLISVQENSKVGTSLLVVKAEDGDRGLSNSVTYKIVNETCPGLFEITPASGEVRLKSVPDRDKGIVHDNNGICTLTVEAKEGQTYPQSIPGRDVRTEEVTITIEDVDDNEPQFNSKSYDAIVAENTPNGVPIILSSTMRVEDIDQGPNANFKVSVLNLPNMFEASPSIVQSTADIIIRVKDTAYLDYELRERISIVIEAKPVNAAANAIGNTVDVTLNLTNVNDETPKFDHFQQTVSIPENVPITFSVATVLARDADKNDDGNNFGKVTYRIDPPDANFRIDSTRGLISTKTTLDRETKDSYYITIVAEDGGHSKVTNQMLIKITDVNDNSPSFVTDDYQTSLQEMDTKFARPVIVHATDNDEPGSPNSQVSYLIVSSTPSNLLTHFSIDSSSGALTVKSPMSYENVFSGHGQNQGNIILTVMAKDNGVPARNSTVNVTVMLQDINNQHPVCSQSKYTTSRAEDSVLDVATVHATDKDGTAPNNLILYSIDQSSSEKFIIDSSSGRITLRSQLDREVQHHYIIAVTVTDLGNPPLSGSCQVEVEVTDVNDSPPVFKEKAVTTNIKENTIFSYELVANDSDLNPNLSYSIDWDKSSGLKVNGESVDGSELKNWIQIQDPHHCKVTSKKNFDREAITKMTIELLVKDLNGKVNVPQTDSATLVVNILDVNDNAPFFNGGPTLVASVRENMPINSSVTFVTPTSLEITDPDEKGPNSEYQVTIEDVKNIFDISPTLGEGHQAFVILVKNSIALDYEKIQSVTVKIIAKNQAFSSTATVTINILNENDNVPVFERSTYSASVAEMSPPHASVISSIKALDKDLGPYGVVSYFLTDDSAKFQIDKNTGYVTTTGDLDRETKSSYTLIITAKDVNGFSSLTQLTVTVTDINDQSPVFDQQNFAVTIEEGEKKFLPSFFVHATDADDPKSPNSQVEYSLIHATTAPLSNFSLSSASGELLMLSPLNFEALSNNGVIVLHVQAKDKGQPARSSSATITVTVLDINDEKPVFPKSLYSVVISENATKGHSVTQLQATDKDKSSTNNQVSYSLDALSNSKFSINPTTGEITVKDVLDREQVDHYSIIVTAADNGQPVQTSTATVSVTVTDVNDSPPQFYKKSVSVQITENVHQVITVFDARDADLNPDLVYSIEWSSSSGVDGHGQFLSGDTLKGYITINPHTGEVSTVNVLDRESIQRFQLTVQVEDVCGIPGTNQLDNAVLTVVVDDVNDNPPKFNDGPHFTAEVQENMPHGSEVKLDGVSGLYIEDPDGVNNNIFNITVSQNNAFSIGPLIGTGSSTCVIKVADSTLLDYEKVQNFTITVVAYDTKNKSLSSKATIFIKLINENDNIPEFIGAPFQGKISENSKSNTYITTVKAHDADLGLYGQISYFLTDDANKFAINSTTGEVYSLVDDLDRETKANYILTVLAKDYSNFTAQAQLSIDVTDIDDMKPVFLNLAYEYNINEGEIKSLTGFYVHATDADDPTTVNSVVNYTLIHTEPNNYSSYFNMSVSTGELMILKALDYEELVSLNLTVQATDQGLAALSATSHIRVNVLDTNDNSPIFELNPYSFSVPENSIKDVAVGNVAATDKDGTPPNNEIYYVIQSGSQDKFQIDSTSGMIKVGLGATLDREAVTKYFLTVLAVDKGTPSKSSSTQVNITVTDVNDELPVILNATSLVGNVREDAKPNFPVMQVSASDPDVNNNLQYYLFWNESKASDEKDRNVDISLLTNWFEINGTTGEIYVNSTLDRETAQQIILKIVVQDMNAEQRAPQTATASATILLTDVNDNRPVIHLDGQQSMLHLNVSEGTKIGTEVTTLLATDADKDQDVTFSVNDSYYFTISPNGRLKLNKPLDRENQSTVSFIIVAQDNGNPPLSSNITVDITVLDINDNDPEFIGNQTVFQVLENSNLSTSICNITATDKDEGANALVTYTFRDETALFNISSQTGEITVAGSLDREKQSVYTLTVLATDNPELEQRRRASLVIQIELLDVNDNDPHFNIPPGVSYIAKIAEDRKINDIVNIQPQPISATDADVGQNAKVTYSLVPSNVSYFNINPQNGQVFVNESMLGAPGDYSLEVKAIDQGNPPRSNLTNLHITILDVNNNNPYFVNSDPFPSIPECTGLATSVYTFKAADNDTDKTSNALVKYYLLNSTEFPDAGYFSLNPDSGEISLEKKLSSEQKDLLKIQVQAEDSGDPPRKSEVLQLNINVLDINDHPPEFIENQNTLFSVKEESIGHVEIGTVFITDRDKGSLLRCKPDDPVNPYKDYFEITTSDRKCTIVGIKPFDRENVSHVSLNLVVEDIALDTNIACQTNSGKDNRLSSPKSVTINIVDINDNPPVFITQSLSKGFLSSSEVEKVILNLNDYVTDRDTDANSKHQFYQLGKLEADEDLSKGWLVNSLPDPIKVDINGSIKTNYKFPEDHYGAITLTVLVNDTAGNDTLNLKIFVVGSPQVVEFSFYKSEDELRRLQQDIAKELSDSSIEFVPDDIVSFKDENNDVDGSKSILLMHALQNGKIIDASRLKEILDHQRQKIETLQGFKIIKTETQEEALKMKKETNDTDRIQYILIGIIAAIALTFIITLAMLIHNIGRFKRKLKAATIEVHGLEPMKFPGLDNPLKDSNPIFNRDDATLESDSDSGHNYDSYSQRSDNSLDKNALGQQEYAEDEQEVVMNMYGGDDAFANLPSPLQYLNDVFVDDERSGPMQRHSDPSQPYDREEEDEVFDFDANQFESTDI